MVAHRHAVMPSDCCGLVSAAVVCMRKNWQFLCINDPRNRKRHSMVWSDPTTEEMYAEGKEAKANV